MADDLKDILRDTVEVLEWALKRENPDWDGAATRESVLGRAREALKDRHPCSAGTQMSQDNG